MSANASATSASLDDLADGLRGGGAHRQLRPCGEPRCLTQGAVSRAIATLEQSLGFILFARTGRRVQLTETGRAYAEQISVALDQIRRATSATIEATGSPAPISVATLPSFDAAIHFGDPDWQGAGSDARRSQTNRSPSPKSKSERCEHWQQEKIRQCRRIANNKPVVGQGLIENGQGAIDLW
jgi:hypothetical protein